MQARDPAHTHTAVEKREANKRGTGFPEWKIKWGGGAKRKRRESRWDEVATKRKKKNNKKNLATSDPVAPLYQRPDRRVFAV